MIAIEGGEGMPEPVLVTADAGVAELTLNRPEIRNALNGAMVAELTTAVRRLAADRSVHAVIVAGAGERAFCAGGDLNEIVGSQGVSGRRAYFSGLVDLFEAIRRAPQPYIAAVHGYAMGGGFGLACACDLTVAAEDAVFGLPEVRVGLFPMVILAPILRLCQEHKRLLELCYLGESIGAEEARSLGVCGRVVAREQLLPTARQMAATVAGWSPAVVAFGKSALDVAAGLPPAQAQSYLREMTVLGSLLDDSIEGMGAFLARRPPEWRGR